MAKGLIEKALGVLVVSAGVFMYENEIVSNLERAENYFVDKMFYVDSENPRGYGVCSLSKEDAGLPVTNADVYCNRVVVGKNPSAELVPQREEPMPKDSCGRFMQRRENGVCEYFPPEE